MNDDPEKEAQELLEGGERDQTAVCWGLVVVIALLLVEGCLYWFGGAW